MDKVKKGHPAEGSEITLTVRIAFPAEQHREELTHFGPRCFPVNLECWEVATDELAGFDRSHHEHWGAW